MTDMTRNDIVMLSLFALGFAFGFLSGVAWMACHFVKRACECREARRVKDEEGGWYYEPRSTRKSTPGVG